MAGIISADDCAICKRGGGALEKIKDERLKECFKQKEVKYFYYYYER